MTEIEAESMSNFDIYEYIKKNFAPVEDKPGYVWFSKRNFQIINIKTLAKSLEDYKDREKVRIRNERRRD